MDAFLFDVDHFAVHDGPGIRTTVFFKGCPLHCKWCHSPESQSCKPEIGFAVSRCVHCDLCESICPHGARSARPMGQVNEKCQMCGCCVQNCPQKALTLFGRTCSLKELVEELLADRAFFENSGGGVTLTGGEVLMQAPFAYALLTELKKESIHTLVETSGYGDRDALLALSEVTDLFYFDFKLWDEDAFAFYTGGDVRIVKRNLESLVQTGSEIVLRVPLIHGITDTVKNIEALFGTAKANGIQQIHLLPYNIAAPEKYAWLGRNYPLDGKLASQQRMEEIVEQAPKGIDVRIV